MKNDKYLKIILTIIAICLMWICVRDIKIGPHKLYANNDGSGDVVDVCIRGIDEAAHLRWEAIKVEVENWPYSPTQQDKENIDIKK